MNDASLRTLVRDNLAARGATAVEEICVRGRQHRLDMGGILAGVFHGIELKSDRDTLNRLRDQARAARPRFRRLVLVVGERHYASAARALPPWWGLWLAHETDAGLALVTDTPPARDAMENPRFNRLAQAKLLWKGELEWFLMREGVELTGTDASRGALAEIAASELTVARVEAEIVRALLARRTTAARERQDRDGMV